MFFNFSWEQLLKHQFVLYVFKFAFGLNFRRNIRSCMFPETVAFKVKKKLLFTKDLVTELQRKNCEYNSLN